MKRIYTSSDVIRVSLLKDILESEGIACFVKNEILTGLAPEIPFTESFPELWVQNDGDLDRAENIKRDWLLPHEVQKTAWTCNHCGEDLDAQFTSCWKCGTPRPSTTASV